MTRPFLATVSVLLCSTATLWADPPTVGELAKARFEAAEKAYRSWEKVEGDRGQPFNLILYELSKRLLEAQIEVRKDSPIQAYEAHLRRMSDWEKEVEKRFRRNFGAGLDVVHSLRLEAELWLAKAKTRSSK